MPGASSKDKISKIKAYSSLSPDLKYALEFLETKGTKVVFEDLTSAVANIKGNLSGLAQPYINTISIHSGIDIKTACAVLTHEAYHISKWASRKYNKKVNKFEELVCDLCIEEAEAYTLQLQVNKDLNIPFFASDPCEAVNRLRYYSSMKKAEKDWDAFPEEFIR